MISIQKRILIGLGLGTLAFLLVFWIGIASSSGGNDSLTRTLDLKFNSLLFKLRGELPADSNIVIVAIDEYSFEDLKKRWPWSPGLHAQLVDSLHHYGAKTIVFDIAFSESSEDLYPGMDAQFATAVARAGNVIIPAKFERLRNPVSGAPEIVFTRPIPEIANAAYSLGITNTPGEIDGTVQRFPSTVMFPFQGEAYPMLTLSAIGAFRDVHPTTSAPSLLAMLGLNDNYRHRTQINFAGPAQSFQTISYYRVIRGDVPPNAFRNKIVLIGATILEMHDYKPTPFSTPEEPNMAGIEIHANIAATLLSQNYISVFPPLTQAALVLIIALLTGILGMFLRPLAGSITVLLFLLGYFGIAVVAFINWQQILPFATVMVVVPLAFILDTIYRYQTVEKARKQMKTLFGRYVPPAVVNEMLRNPDFVNLGGVRKRATLMFSDIRGFTSMSGEMAPEEVVSILNAYFGLMTRIVWQYKGTVDKYIGDGLMVSFGIPVPRENHAELAIQTALEMQRAMHTLNKQLAKRLKTPLKIGIGINTGWVIAGNIGSDIHTDYTAIGDTVNVTSRLESMTKTLGANIIVSEATYQEAKGKFLFRDLGLHTLRGKSEPARLYQVLSKKMKDESAIEERELHYEDD